MQHYKKIILNLLVMCIAGVSTCLFGAENHQPENNAYLGLQYASEKPLLACDFAGCTYTAKSNDSLRKHKNTHTKPYACNWPECDYTAAESSTVKVHRRKHTGEKPYACDWPGCNYTAAQSSIVTTHRRKHTGELFECGHEGCDYTAAKSSTVKAHRRTHTGEKPFACDWPGCDYTTANSSTVKAHKRTHTGEKPYACDWPGCDYMTAQLNNVKTHRRTHTGEKPFACDWPECNYTAANSSTVKAHRRTHTGEKYESGFKGYSYASTLLPNAETHRKTPSDIVEQQFACEKCPYTISDPEKLKTHKLLEHSKKIKPSTISSAIRTHANEEPYANNVLCVDELLGKRTANSAYCAESPPAKRRKKQPRVAGNFVTLPAESLELNYDLGDNVGINSPDQLTEPEPCRAPLIDRAPLIEWNGTPIETEEPQPSAVDTNNFEARPDQLTEPEPCRAPLIYLGEEQPSTIDTHNIDTHNAHNVDTSNSGQDESWLTCLN